MTFGYSLVTGRYKKIQTHGGVTMIQKLSTKLQVQLSVPGVEKLKKVTFQNVVDNPDEAEILKLGQLMKELDVEGTLLDGVIITSQSRVSK
ncbi:hypothetical protein [Enterococcus hulanensis]